MPIVRMENSHKNIKQMSMTEEYLMTDCTKNCENRDSNKYLYMNAHSSNMRAVMEQPGSRMNEWTNQNQ